MMKISFSTLGCPDWTFTQCVEGAKKYGFQGVELRYVAGTDALWELPDFSTGLAASKRLLADAGIACSDVGARAHFHFPDAAKRKEMIDEAKRNIDIAAGLGSPGVRVWGDKIQKGADRTSTMQWISEAIWALAEYGRPANVEVWLESHGDFTASADVVSILRGCGCHGAAATWDPQNALIAGEDPEAGAKILGPYIKHVHFKDQNMLGEGKREVKLLGEGQVPLTKILDALVKLRYQGFVSFEWEKRNFKTIPEPEVAFPHFAAWWKKNGR